MGLDLVPLGRAKPGHEEEWERLMRQLYKGEAESEAAFERRNEISILPYEAVGAPRVGSDAAADRWMLQQRPADSSMTDDEWLAEYKGHYVVRLATCDGVPNYSNGGMYEGIDETCFRGEFLKFCTAFLDKQALEAAWTDRMPPADAVAYGRKLLALSAAEAQNQTRKRFFSFGKSREEPVEEQRKILDAAGRWYIYWGERGHPIAAYY
jgi:hypothetical protein